MQITTPTLLLDYVKCKNNIKNMASLAQRTHVRLRPHFKTHQSAQIASWYRQYGVNAITVSSVKMASYFANHGWDDITIAFPVNIREIEDINHLAAKITVNLIIEASETIYFLEKNLTHQVNTFLKIDTGYKRTGIEAGDINSISHIVDILKDCKKMIFKGFLAHTGQNYGASSKEEILSNHHQTVLDLNELKNNFRKDFPDIEASLGDTPACSLSQEFYGIDEIRPGNFVFYDIMQYVLGSCSEDDIAVAMACPVVAKHPQRNEVIIYGGGVHFSKEYLEADNEGTKLFGSLVSITEKGWGPILQGGYLASLSQEHGIIRCNDTLFNQIAIGDLIGVLPIHSCMTANLMGRYLTIDGEIISMMER